MTSRASLIDALENAIASGSEEKRVDTLRRITDLFALGAQNLSEAQVAVFDDVIGRLADDIEIKARAELARRLAPIANAPIEVVRALARAEEIDVAGPILTGSARLDERDLVQAAKLRGQEHLMALSKRQGLSASVTDVLVVRGDQHVVRSVAQNEAARFSDAGFGVMVKRSKGDEVLAEHVGLRSDVPRKHLETLLVTATDRVMKRLAAAASGTHPHIQEVLADIAAHIKEKAAPAPRNYAAARTLVEALKNAGKLDEVAVHNFARAGKFEETAVALSLQCRLAISEIERAMSGQDPESDLILIVTRAAGLSWPTTRTIMLLQNSSRPPSPQDVDTAKKNFERLQITTAQRVVRFYQVRQSASKNSAAIDHQAMPG